MNYIRTIFALAAVIVMPLTVVAQTLPQSTQDRQEIANLIYQANLPGTSQADRAEIQRRITQLQYQINTAPPIAPMPTVAPLWNGNGPVGQLPQVNVHATPVPLSPTVYGSCDGDRAVIAYLNQQLELPTLTIQERRYAQSRRDELVNDLRTRRC
ncbi:MAG TPA: hypothetical protein VFN49_04025 [Candidatus Aquilonibacter sp.]|nr:hypothetical protein [Candidatus Aquilonibacter sp.]